MRQGCRWGFPHDPVILHESPKVKVEKCKLCGVRKRFNKNIRGRTDNLEYLHFHIRSFAQPYGSTRRVFVKINNPDLLTIKV
jgi:hypothetical protein